MEAHDDYVDGPLIDTRYFLLYSNQGSVYAIVSVSTPYFLGT